MDATKLTNLYYADFSQVSMVSASYKPKSATKFSKQFKQHIFNTNNLIKIVDQPQLLDFLKESLPSLELTQQKIGARLRQFETSKINDHPSIKYAYTRKLESWNTPALLNNQKFSLYAIYPDFEENLQRSIVSRKPTAAEISFHREKKISRLNSTVQKVHLGLLFENNIADEDKFPVPVETTVSEFFRKNGVSTRIIDDKTVRVDFEKTDFLSIKALYETFQNCTVRSKKSFLKIFIQKSKKTKINYC